MRLRKNPVPRLLGWCPALLLFATLAWGAPEKVLPPGSRVAVLDPWSGTRGDPEVKAFGDSLRFHLDRSVAIVSGGASSPDRFAFSPADSCIELSCATQWGRTLGADRVIFGAWAKAGSQKFLIVRVVDVPEGRIVHTLLENDSDTVPLARLARKVATSLMYGIEASSPPPLPACRRSLSNGDSEMRKLQEEKDNAQTAAFVSGGATSLLLFATLGIGIMDPNNLNLGNLLVFGGGMIGSGIVLFTQLARLDVANTKIHALEKKRKADLQILPYIDPLHGTTGALARVGF